MKQLFFLIFLFCFGFSFAQKSTYKSFNDSNFKKGDKIIVHDLIFTDTRLDARSSEALKNMVTFIQKHPNLEFEIGVHSGARGSELYNKKMSAARAQEVVDSLSKGHHIPLKQLVPYGYGESSPLHTDEEIQKTGDLEKKEQLQKENARVELKILGKLG